MNRVLIASACFISLWGCANGATTKDTAAADAGQSAEQCTTGEVRCSDSAFQTCSNGVFLDSDVCSGTEVCSQELGCIECRPEEVRACVGDTVHECKSDGTLGELYQECPVGSCQAGACVGALGGSCAGNGTELIYVVDDQQNLYSFDPAKLASDPFLQIGTMACDAAPSLIDGAASHPFSMSVDRDGTAWVLYNSGEIFHVSTMDASCQTTNWVVGTGDFELFGMGFVSDASGEDSETLYISGGLASSISSGNIGAIDPTDLSISTVGPLPMTTEVPELTGTGGGTLFGFLPGTLFPTTTPTLVGEIDKVSGEMASGWTVTGVDGLVFAWAFAHYGGRFYIFINSGLISVSSYVLELDPVTGLTTKVVANSARKIVGAGVSTCVPTQID